MSVQNGKWRVLSQTSSQFLGKVRGRGPQEDHHLEGLPSQVSAPEGKASVEKRANQALWLKGNLLEGTRGWLALQDQCPPFLTGSFLNLNSENFSEQMVNFSACSWVLWSHSRRSGIWWSHSFEKIGALEKTEYCLGNVVNLKGHCELILCLRGQHNEPSYEWAPMWALSNC